MSDTTTLYLADGRSINLPGEDIGAQREVSRLLDRIFATWNQPSRAAIAWGHLPIAGRQVAINYRQVVSIDLPEWWEP